MELNCHLCRELELHLKDVEQETAGIGGGKVFLFNVFFLSSVHIIQVCIYKKTFMYFLFLKHWQLQINQFLLRFPQNTILFE